MLEKLLQRLGQNIQQGRGISLAEPEEVVPFRLDAGQKEFMARNPGATMMKPGWSNGATAQALAPTLVPTSLPTPAPDPSPTLQQPHHERTFDFAPYLEHLANPPEIPQPPEDIANIMWDTFPQDATRSALTAWSESKYDPRAVGTNTTGRLKGTQDIGLMQMNAGVPDDPTQTTTLMDLLTRKPTQMREAGAINQQALLDPAINAAAAKINFDESPQAWWGRWYGPRRLGVKEEHFNTKYSPF